MYIYTRVYICERALVKVQRWIFKMKRKRETMIFHLGTELIVNLDGSRETRSHSTSRYSRRVSTASRIPPAIPLTQVNIRFTQIPASIYESLWLRGRRSADRGRNRETLASLTILSHTEQVLSIEGTDTRSEFKWDTVLSTWPRASHRAYLRYMPPPPARRKSSRSSRHLEVVLLNQKATDRSGR